MAPHYPPGYLDATAQPLMIGFMLSAPLYGIAIAQAIYYFRTFAKDVIYVKLVVVSLIIIDTAHLVLLISTIDNWFLVDFFSPTGTVLLTHIAVFICQMTYAARIWIVSSKRIAITGLVVALALLQLSAFRIIVLPAIFNLYFQAAVSVQANGVVERTAQVANKIVTYCFHLGELDFGAAKSQPPHRHLTFIDQWLVKPKKLYWGIFELLLSKIYFNPLLVMLNSRAKLREQLYGSTANTAGNTSGSDGGSGTRNTANGWRK
ncbi:hypothetical protein B0H11DRAFT_2207947 [Mycena galericulata]|nr:hypothetical protein B0H11DRAFT_2207947 [Mycena galericulata]